MPGQEWDCEAYGPEGTQAGALCFFGGELPQRRACKSLAECHQRMTAERQRVFLLIHLKASMGDEDAAYLASVFTSPEQLLGGGEPAPDDGEGSDG